ILLIRLEKEGFTDSAEAIRQSTMRICQLAAHIAVQYGVTNAHARAAVSAGLLSRERNSMCVQYPKQEAEQVTDPADRERAVQTIASQDAEYAEEIAPSEEIPMPMER